MATCYYTVIWKGEDNELQFPFNVSGDVTEISLELTTIDNAKVVFDDGLVIEDGNVFVNIDEDDLDTLKDGVIKYQISAVVDGNDIIMSNNTNYVLKTPGSFTGKTGEELYNDGYLSGSTDGFNEGYESGATDGYNSGTTDGYNSGVTAGFTDGYNSGRTDGYDEGYQDGLTDGYNSGYTSGRTDGYNDGYQSGSSAGYEEGYADGRTDGYNQGRLDGHIEGYNEGYATGHTNGFTQGYNQGKTDGNAEGYQSGTGDGFTIGYESGHTDGYREGMLDGSSSGYSQGYQSGHTDGYNDGYAAGRTDGYQNGYEEGRTAGYNEGYAAGDGNGYQHGYEVGYSYGYQVGKAEGKEEGFNSGHTAGYSEGRTDGYGVGFTEGFEQGQACCLSGDCSDAYDNGYNDGFNDGYLSGQTDCSGETPDCTAAYESGYTAGFEDGLNACSGDCSEAYESGVTQGQALQKAKLTGLTATTNMIYERADGYNRVVINVPQTGYTQQDLDNAWAAGHSSGYTDGINDADCTEAYQTGYNTGYNTGYADGYNEGYNEGQDACENEYSNMYLTLDVVSGGNIYYQTASSGISGGSITRYIEYSRDNGETWETMPSPSNITYHDSDSIVSSISAETGDKILFRGLNGMYGSPDGVEVINGHVSQFISVQGIHTASYNVYGNIMSMIYGSGFTGQMTMVSANTFAQFFMGAPVLDASNLVLPSTSLTAGCYASMFYSCTLTKAPKLPAATLANGCYWHMFRFCSSLTEIKCLATDISATNCTYRWVEGVSETGTFIKSRYMNDWITGPDFSYRGIPEGWNIHSV